MILRIASGGNFIQNYIVLKMGYYTGINAIRVEG